MLAEWPVHLPVLGALPGSPWGQWYSRAGGRLWALWTSRGGESSWPAGVLCLSQAGREKMLRYFFESRFEYPVMLTYHYIQNDTHSKLHYGTVTHGKIFVTA